YAVTTVSDGWAELAALRGASLLRAGSPSKGNGPRALGKVWWYRRPGRQEVALGSERGERRASRAYWATARGRWRDRRKPRARPGPNLPFRRRARSSS